MRTLTGRDRARVPFALVGVVLLVTSTAFHASLGTTPAVREPDTEAALERAGAAAVPAIRVAVREAARAAAADPVVTPANSTVGRALNGSRPFRDALRLRIYLAARERLTAAAIRRSDLRATATLPPVDDGSAAVRRAIDRIRIARTGPNGTRLRVRVRNVALSASRGDRVVTRRSFTPTVTVDTPVLALHDRTERYERRLDAPTLSSDGAGARLTLGTYLVASGRGTAQWAGAPIANVLSNRHVALATDAAVYDTQARTFGARDPEWLGGLGAAAGRALASDAVELGFEGTKRRRSRAGATAMDVLKRLLSGSRPSRTHAPRPFARNSVTVDVGRSSDAAAAALLRRRERGPRNLTRVLREAYTVDARLATRTQRLGARRAGRRRPAEPGDWRLVDRERQVDRLARAVDGDGVSVSTPEPPASWHRLDAARRRVVERETVIRRWRDGNRTAVTRRRTVTRYGVAVAVVGRHARPELSAPGRPLRPVHERGGALDGPSLSGIAARATERLVASRGGFGPVAERAVAGSVNTTSVQVVGDRPPGLDRWVSTDLRGLHRRVRNVSVRSSRRDLGTLDAAPAADLAAALRQRRRELVDAPRAYDGAADRARVAARAAYLDRVLARLEARAERRNRAQRRLNDSLVSRGIPSLDRIERLRAAAENATAAGPSRRTNGGSGQVQFVPDAAPSRLALTDVSRRAAGLRGDGSVRPLAATNLNAFALPFDDAASLARSGSGETVPLRTAARVLRGTRTLPDGGAARNESLTSTRAHLREAVVAGNDALRARVRALLRREGIEGATRRRALVTEGLSPWNTPASRTLALVNGSAATGIAEAAAESDGTVGNGSVTADRLEILLRAELRRALEGEAGRVPRRPVERTDRLARDLTDAAVTQTARTTAERAGDAVGRRVAEAGGATVPAGLPVLPPVQPWYATVNVWHVRVRGVHPSLVVRAVGRGPPASPLAYERDGSPVRLDVDADGERERLGRATRVAFDIETAVLVVVPPGGRGVGDTNGDADERTGWPTPAPWPGRQSSGPAAATAGA